MPTRHGLAGAIGVRGIDAVDAGQSRTTEEDAEPHAVSIRQSKFSTAEPVPNDDSRLDYVPSFSVATGIRYHAAVDISCVADHLRIGVFLAGMYAEPYPVTSSLPICLDEKCVQARGLCARVHFGLYTLDTELR